MLGAIQVTFTEVLVILKKSKEGEGHERFFGAYTNVVEERILSSSKNAANISQMIA